MKIIFLDVDGVLNCDYTTNTTSRGYIFVEDEFIRRLKKIVDETGAAIVLSSDWRMGKYYDFHEQELNELIAYLKKFNITIYDYTGEECDTRGEEIKNWMDAHAHDGIDNIVILDDRYDMAPYMDNLVRTRMCYGLTEHAAAKAIKILNGSNA